MITKAENYYDLLYSSIFNKLKPQTIKQKLKSVSRIIEDDVESDIIKDRDELRNLIKSFNKNKSRPE